MPTPATFAPAALDLRTIAPRHRHAMLFGRFDGLQAGQAMQLVNDHDPQPPQFQLNGRAFNRLEWATLESGPTVWRVQITRASMKPIPTATDSSCSGGAYCG